MIIILWWWLLLYYYYSLFKASPVSYHTPNVKSYQIILEGLGLSLFIHQSYHHIHNAYKIYKFLFPISFSIKIRRRDHSAHHHQTSVLSVTEVQAILFALDVIPLAHLVLNDTTSKQRKARASFLFTWIWNGSSSVAIVRLPWALTILFRPRKLPPSQFKGL